MYQLNYRSESIPELESKDLADILEEANARNSEKNITGCLIYHEKSFVQILEGNKIDVLEIYEKITTDKRHHKVTLLWENDVESRYFTEWNMAYHQPEDRNLKLYVNNLLLLSQLSNRSSASLLSFWATVRTILRGDEVREFEIM